MCGKGMTSPGCSGWAGAEDPGEQAVSDDISTATDVLLLVLMVLMLLWEMSFHCHCSLSPIRWSLC